MNNPEKAVKKFTEGFNCAQSVLYSMEQYTSLDEENSLILASGFGAGMGRSQNVCGAVSGGILALNLLYGPGIENDPDTREELYKKIRTLIQKFENEKKTVNCRELIDGIDLVSKEGQEHFKASNMKETCKEYISLVVEILEEIIEE